MANLTITLNTNARQDVKLATFLTHINLERISSGEAVFPDITSCLRFVLIEAVKGYVRQIESAESGEVGLAFSSANDTIQGQVKTLLGIT